MRNVGLAMFAGMIVVGLAGCSKTAAPLGPGDAAEIKVGGLYAVRDSDKSWLVMKVLAVEPETVHLRSYANKFSKQPARVDPAKLTLGSVQGSGGFGIGHFPLDKKRFLADRPVFLEVLPVADEELEGYKTYLDAMKSSK